MMNKEEEKNVFSKHTNLYRNTEINFQISNF